MDVHRNGSIKGKKKICEKTEADNYETKGETRYFIDDRDYLKFIVILN